MDFFQAWESWPLLWKHQTLPIWHPSHDIPRILRETLTGWWFFSTHLKNMRKSKWESSPNRGENKKYLKPPPRLWLKPICIFWLFHCSTEQAEGRKLYTPWKIHGWNHPVFENTLLRSWFFFFNVDDTLQNAIPADPRSTWAAPEALEAASWWVDLGECEVLKLVEILWGTKYVGNAKKNKIKVFLLHSFYGMNNFQQFVFFWGVKKWKFGGKGF